MIIKKRKKNVKTPPTLGDARWIRRFAFLPIPIDANRKLWLEEYFILQKFTKGVLYFDGNPIGTQNRWVDQYNEGGYPEITFEDSDIRLKEV